MREFQHKLSKNVDTFLGLLDPAVLGYMGGTPTFKKYQSQEQNSVGCIVADDDVSGIVSGLGEFKISLCKGLRWFPSCSPSG